MGKVFMNKLKDIYFVRSAPNTTIVMGMIKMDTGRSPKTKTFQI
jgi:hypothetical protein